MAHRAFEGSSGRRDCLPRNPKRVDYVTLGKTWYDNGLTKCQYFTPPPVNPLLSLPNTSLHLTPSLQSKYYKPKIPNLNDNLEPRTQKP